MTTEPHDFGGWGVTTPRPPAVLDPDQFARLNDEWAVWKERAATRGDVDNAVAWVLVNVFGDREAYHYDPTFYAQVRHAVLMLRELRFGGGE